MFVCASSGIVTALARRDALAQDCTMRVLFVTNQRKTEFFERVARVLRSQGVQVFWISTGGRWTRFLRDAGWPASTILSLERFGAEWSSTFEPTADDWKRAARIEASAAISLKNILIMDRELNKRPGFSVEGYVHVVLREIERFIIEKDIHFGFGEDTWAPEILTYVMMSSLNRRYYAMLSIRMPSHRFGFFRSVFQDSLEVVGPIQQLHREIATQTIKGLRERGERPFYFERFKGPQRLRPHWLEELYLALMRRSESRYDHSLPPLTTRLRRRLAARRNIAQSKHVFEVPQLPNKRPYALVLLQRQPEASVDVYGKYFSDQLEVIRALVRILPFDWEVWCKEHPHGVGDRSLQYLRDLQSLPGVRVVHYDADTLTLVKQAALVISVSGTTSFEAAVLNVPSITLVPVFFGSLLLENGLNPFAINHHDMAAILARHESIATSTAREQLVEDFMSDLASRSFDGIIGDPITTPECVSPENVSNVANGCLQMMQYVESTQGRTYAPIGSRRPD